MELSIVIPTFNRASSLKKALQSIIEQENASSLFEVIVVDNGSTDETRNVCRNFEDLFPNLFYHYDAEPGQLTGRHKGTELARGNIISFIDDDVELNHQWIRSIFQLFNDNPSVSIVGGPCLPKYELYPPSWIHHFWQPTLYGGSMCLPLSLIDLGQKQLEVDPLYVFGLNYSIRKQALLELGGFHPDCIPQHLQKYQGDGETGLSLKARSRGMKALYASSAFLYHKVPVERLIPDYFEKWYYYSGVCQSFTNIRSRYRPDVKQAVHVNRGADLINKVFRGPGNLLKKVFNGKKNRLPDDIAELQSRFHSRYLEGYGFHQSIFETDDTVKNWVLRNDYWNYKLPV